MGQNHKHSYCWNREHSYWTKNITIHLEFRSHNETKSVDLTAPWIRGRSSSLLIHKRMYLPLDSAKCCNIFFYGGDVVARSTCKELFRIDRSMLLQADYNIITSCNIFIDLLLTVKKILDRLFVSPISIFNCIIVLYVYFFE